MVRGVWRLDIRLWQEVWEQVGVVWAGAVAGLVEAAVAMEYDVDGVDDRDDGAGE